MKRSPESKWASCAPIDLLPPPSPHARWAALRAVCLPPLGCGFYTDEILSALEERSVNYIIAAKAYSNLKNEVYGMKDWVEVCPGIAVKEWRHQHANPKAKARRHIVVRKQTSRRPQAAGKLLFEDQPDYRFSLYVTNLDLPLDQIWNIYNSRADCEPSAAR